MNSDREADIEELKYKISDIIDQFYNFKVGQTEELADEIVKLVSTIKAQAVLEATEAGLKGGFYAGQAMARVELEDCHANWKKWNTPDTELKGKEE